MRETRSAIMDEELRPDIQYLVFRKCPPTWRIPEHFVDDCDITYVVDGSARYTINGTTYDVAAGDLIYMPDGDLKTAVTDPKNPMHCFSVNITLKNAKGKEVFLPFPRISHIGYQKDVVFLFRELIYAWFNRMPGYALQSRGLLLLLLHQFYELTSDTDRTFSGDFRIKKATRYIVEHYREKITVKALASAAKLNTAYFGSLFKKETGLTLNQYLVKTRVRNAEYLLRSGECNVGEAACNCGFSDIAHFYKNFKALTGMAPSLFMPRK